MLILSLSIIIYNRFLHKEHGHKILLIKNTIHNMKFKIVAKIMNNFIWINLKKLEKYIGLYRKVFINIFRSMWDIFFEKKIFINYKYKINDCFISFKKWRLSNWNIKKNLNTTFRFIRCTIWVIENKNINKNTRK